MDNKLEQIRTNMQLNKQEFCKKLDVTYRMAWYRGLKTTYYLRAIGATSAEKSTISDGALNAVKAVVGDTMAAAPVAAPVPKACSIDNPDCEACQ